MARDQIVQDDSLVAVRERGYKTQNMYLGRQKFDWGGSVVDNDSADCVLLSFVRGSSLQTSTMGSKAQR